MTWTLTDPRVDYIVSPSVDQSVQGWISQSKCGSVSPSVAHQNQSVSPRMDRVQQQVGHDVCYGVSLFHIATVNGGWRWRATCELLTFSKYRSI